MYYNYKLIVILVISRGIISIINSRIILKNINECCFDTSIRYGENYKLEIVLDSNVGKFEMIKKFMYGITYYHQTGYRGNDFDGSLGAKDALKVLRSLYLNANLLV